jgi:hypothetical protein
MPFHDIRNPSGDAMSIKRWIELLGRKHAMRAQIIHQEKVSEIVSAAAALPRLN